MTSVNNNENDVSLENILHRCGGFGRFQLFHYFFLNLLEISAGLVAFYYVYGVAEPDHRCRLPATIWPDDLQYNPINSTQLELVNLYIPRDDDDHKKWNPCQMYNAATVSNRTLVTCPNGWIFDRNIYGFTLTEEANFICDSKSKRSWLSTMVQLAGFFLLIVGTLADRFGRRTVIIGVNFFLFTIGIFLQILIQWIPMSMNTKFGLLLVNQLIAGLSSSTSSIAFVLMLELTTSPYRSRVGNIALIFFAFGAAFATFFAYFARHWEILLWTTTCFIGLSLPYAYFMTESPLYLYSKQQFTRLELLLRKMATMNGRQESDWYPSFQQFIQRQSSEVERNGTEMNFSQKIQQLFCHRVMLKHLCISCSMAFTGMLLFIKISYGLATMNISPYAGILIGAVVEVMGYISASLLMSTRLGRKYTLMCVTGLTCACVFAIPSLTKYNTIGTVIVSQLGKFSISASIATTWIYISELFPTSIRNSANGVAVAISRLGAITAPVVDSSIGDQYLSITFYIYGSLALLVLLIIVFLPETRDTPLEDNILLRTQEKTIKST